MRDRPRFNDTLDSVKFVCKDVWITVWEKQVDNLRTNHRVSALTLLVFHANVALRVFMSFRITPLDP